MSLDAIIGIGWRDLVLVIAALLGVYLVLSVMRLFQIDGRRRRSAAMEREVHEDFDYAQMNEPLVGDDAVMQLNDRVEIKGMGDINTSAAPVFANELARSNVEAEVTRLHREAAQLRTELARVAEEVSHLKAQRNVSPLYSEAMSLAQQGMPAAGIAGHCGISVGEAELVAALARNESEFKPQEDEEDGNERYIGTGTRS